MVVQPFLTFLEAPARYQNLWGLKLPPAPFTAVEEVFLVARKKLSDETSRYRYICSRRCCAKKRRAAASIFSQFVLQTSDFSILRLTQFSAEIRFKSLFDRSPSSGYVTSPYIAIRGETITASGNTDVSKHLQEMNGCSSSSVCSRQNIELLDPFVYKLLTPVEQGCWYSLALMKRISAEN